MPTFIAFKDGQKVGTQVGADMAKIEALIQQCVPVTACAIAQLQQHTV